LEATKKESIICIIGLPVKSRNQLFNSAVVFQWGKLLGIVPKNYLASYNEFYESRWFSSAQDAVRKELFIFDKRAPIARIIFLATTS
jgi:NAD+ synthase (glutamine-hydrolysing)